MQNVDRSQWTVWAVRVVLVGLFLWMSYQALQYSLYKYASLGFSGEFCYYSEMATSLPDPELSELYNFNPFGQNVFGYAGYEGTDNFYYSVHFEPIKFLYVPLYGLTGRFSALFLFLSLGYFSPLLYLALVAPLKERARQVMAVAWAAIYVLYPPVMEVASFDLRPRSLLGPALVLLLIAVLYRRPLWEKALALVFLFAVREEAILLAPFLILIDWLSSSKGKARRKSLIVLSVIWVVGTITALWFFEWGGFAQSGKIAQMLAGNLGWAATVLMVGLGFLGWMVWIYHARGSDPVLRWRLKLIAWLPVFGLVGGGGLLAYFNAYDAPTLAGLIKYLNAEFLYTARLSVLFAGLWGGLGLVWEGLQPKGRKYANYVFLGLVLLSAVGTVVISPRVKASFGKNIDRVLVPEHAAEVWDLRAQTDLYSTEVLWDYNTMTAFCDYEHSYGLERSPYFLVGDTDELNYPENVDTLKFLLAERVEVIVIHRVNQEIVEGLLAELSITPRKVQVSEYGGRYLIYWVE
jgi:hypothetical protein